MSRILMFLPIIIIALIIGIFSHPRPRQPTVTSVEQTESEALQNTVVSAKPRDKVIQYVVTEGDTLPSIAEKFAVSADTVRWANNMQSDSVSVGTILAIPPVTGVVHTVTEGETIYTIAAKYNVDAQNIVNFPFNEFKDFSTYELTPGQTLYIPDGIPQ